jgi:Holliday junction resolvase RusA-like endonuclease
VKIIIPGDPIPKARARVLNKGFAYDPQWEMKDRVSKFMLKEVENVTFKRFDDQPLEVNWCFYMPIPKSFSSIKRNKCKWGVFEHTIRPDLSNLQKFYEDCANGILWKDDSQITTGKINKRYCDNDNPRTEIEMTPVKEINEEMTEIVSLFSPEEISAICYDASKITMNLDNLPRIAKFLSKIADQHSKKLNTINKKFPGYWKRFDKN